MIFKKKLTHIGTNLLVSFPDEGISCVEAKIDTGADSSAVWASDINEKNKELSFRLFDVDSPHYTGKVIRTSDYKVTNVKNSFGDSEERYKVKLKLSIAGKNINSTFTLANRGKNSYSVLIGKRTLHGKFLVDVSQKEA
jgi:hypothetical protein